jgi:RNA polymerase sigma factor (sigma-70 family)
MGPMVLGVCKSVLHNLHDAEDAFQAAFLVLARKAGSIHRREAVSAWLYRVAYHLAVKAQASAARRKIHEQRAAAMPPADPVLDMSLRELRNVLNEELRRLPEQYRAPVVLCCLEEKSLEEAARLLGWTKGAVKGRLQRGRERLRQRLRRRGLNLSAGLIAVALSTSSASAQVSAALTASTLRAALQVAAGEKPAAGVISANVAALVQGASQTMFLRKLQVVTILVLAIGLSAAGLGALSHRGLSARQADPGSEETAKPVVPAEKMAKDSRTIRGRVLGPDGKAFMGAKLYLVAPGGEKAGTVRATSGEDGRFEFSFAASDLDKTVADQPAGQVIAVAEGRGFDWALIGEADKDRALTLRLVEDVPIRGRVLDQDGKPVAGARVRVLDVAAYPGEDLTKTLADIRQRGWSASAAKTWDGPPPGQARVLTASADGRFRMAGFGRERTVRLIVEGPAIHYTWITAMTRAGEAVVGPKPMAEGAPQGKVYGASFDYLAAASRPIRGVVRDKDTGEPIAGVTLRTDYLTTHTTRTDRDGSYELLGCPKTSTYTLIARPPDDGRYFMIQAHISDTPGLGPLTADIGLSAGIPVRGRVLDRDTGKPVPGARVSYHVLFPNTKAGRLEDYLEHQPPSSATTGPDGSFAVAVLPGPGVLAATAQPLSSYRPAFIAPKELENFLEVRPESGNSPDALIIAGTGRLAASGRAILNQNAYNALALINPGEKDKELVRDLILLPALVREGMVVDPDGKPLPGALALGLTTGQGDGLLKSATFTVRGLHPERVRQLFFYHKGRGLGRFLELRGDEKGPLTVSLRPCGSATGRIVTKDGKPVADVLVCICREGYDPFLAGGVEAKTDQDGRFRAEGLVPGQKYRLARPNQIDERLAEVLGESGKRKDLGDLIVEVRD